MRRIFPMFPWFSQQSSRSLGVRRRSAEAALTGEGTLVLLITITIVIVGGWLIWQYSTSTEEEARAYADRSIQRLAFAHDANYLATNLSATALPGYPPTQQQYIMAHLTKLGVPVAPVKITGSVSHSSISDAQDPEARFKAHLIYPTVEAHVYLDVACRHGRWQIDSFAAEWHDKPASP